MALVVVLAVLTAVCPVTIAAAVSDLVGAALVILSVVAVVGVAAFVWLVQAPTVPPPSPRRVALASRSARVEAIGRREVPAIEAPRANVPAFPGDDVSALSRIDVHPHAVTSRTLYPRGMRQSGGRS